MKKNPLLRRRIMIDLGVLTLFMVIVYTFLIGYFMSIGMDEVSSYDMYLKAKKFALNYENNPNTPLPQGSRLKAYLKEENLPPWLWENISPKQLEHGKVWIDDIPSPEKIARDKNASSKDASDKDPGEQGFFVILPYDLHDGNRLYLLEEYLSEDLLDEVFKSSDRLEMVVLVVGIGFIFIILIAVRYTFYRLSIPLNALSNWADTLSREKQDQPHPDFHYQEINQLADIVQNAVQEQNRAMQREHSFLRNASHELRTPIAILRSNIDLLERIRPASQPGEKIPHERIKRAMDKMQRLTETLLWLSRKESKMPEAKSVDLDRLVKELVRENQHLLTGKKVDLSLDLVPARVEIPLAPGNIVIGNLIRNAFQYTTRGKINISVRGNCVVIRNTNKSGITKLTEENNQDYGFGLGLDLVDQISIKMSWEYENVSIAGGHKASLKF